MLTYPPQLATESAKAYAAFTTYCTFGAARSLAKVGLELGKSTVLIERWSSQHDWQDRVRSYDEAMARVQANEVAQRYKYAVRDHFDRYHDVGLKLHFTAKALLDRLYENIDAMPINPALLATIARSLTIAADIEAHALQLGQLIPALEKLQADSLSDETDLRSLTDEQLHQLAKTGKLPAPAIHEASYKIFVQCTENQPNPTNVPKTIDYIKPD